MMLMHDGLILDLTPQDFIFKAVIFVVVFVIAFLIEHFAVKLSKKAWDSSCFWHSTNSVCNCFGSHIHCLFLWSTGHYF